MTSHEPDGQYCCPQHNEATEQAAREEAEAHLASAHGIQPATYLGLDPRDIHDREFPSCLALERC